MQRRNPVYRGSKDLEQRMEKHNQGKASKYTRARLPVKIVYQEQYANMSEALKREKAIQKLSRIEKQKLCKKV